MPGSGVEYTRACTDLHDTLHSRVSEVVLRGIHFDSRLNTLRFAEYPLQSGTRVVKSI